MYGDVSFYDVFRRVKIVREELVTLSGFCAVEGRILYIAWLETDKANTCSYCMREVTEPGVKNGEGDR
jgi:hypothetical protein